MRCREWPFSYRTLYYCSYRDDASIAVQSQCNRSAGPGAGGVSFDLRTGTWDRARQHSPGLVNQGGATHQQCKEYRKWDARERVSGHDTACARLNSAPN